MRSRGGGWGGAAASRSSCRRARRLRRLLTLASPQGERRSLAALLARQRQVAAGHRRGLHPRRRRLPEGEEAVEHAGENVEALEIDLEEGAILPRDAIAFDDLR